MARELVVFKEKNGSRVFDLDASGGWERVCMTVFLERLEQGWYGKKKKRAPKPPKVLSMADITDASKVAAYAKNLKRHETALAAYNQHSEDWGHIEKAKGGDLAAAQEIIEDRKGNRYEGFRLLFLSAVPDTVVRWTYPHHIQAANFARFILQVMDDPDNPENTARMANTPDLIRLYRETTTKPPQPGYFDVPECPSSGGWKLQAAQLMQALEHLFEKGLTNLGAQDLVRWTLSDCKVEFDGAQLARQRMEKFGGDVPGVARTRFIDKYDREPTTHQDRILLDNLAKETIRWLH